MCQQKIFTGCEGYIHFPGYMHMLFDKRWQKIIQWSRKPFGGKFVPFTRRSYRLL